MNQMLGKPPLGLGINWTHPLSKGLIGCWLFNEGVITRFQNLATLTQTDVVPFDANIKCEGDYLYMHTTSHAVVANCPQANIDLNTSPISVSTKINWAGNDTGICGNFDSSSSYRGWAVQKWDSGAKIIMWIINSYPGNIVQIATNISDLDGTPFTATITYDGVHVDGNCLAYYINGTQRANIVYANTLSATTLSAIPFALFGRGDAAPVFGGYIYYLYIWNRTLTSSEALQLHVDPYCFIQPMRPVWLKQYAAPAVGIPTHMDYFRRMRMR